MPITFNCPCGKTLRVPDEYAGRRAKCPACGALVDIPAPDPVFEVVEPPPGKRTTATPSTKPLGKQPPKPDADDDSGTYRIARD